MRVLVCGGRDYSDIRKVFATLGELSGMEFLMFGCASGADAIAHQWGERMRMDYRKFFAKWTEQGKGAGPIRNQRMLDEGKPDLVVAFPGGSGTADMVRRAKAAGVRVIEV
jgi:UDP-N-acetylmuramoylalanine-D-glutamate ligase